MLGLTALLHTVDPETTLQKFKFLMEYGLTHAHALTTTISFGALFMLVAMRSFKDRFRKTWWIYRIPEVLVVVILSTGS